MATADEKQELGLPPDASEEQVKNAIAELIEKAKTADTTATDIEAKITDAQMKVSEAEDRANQAEERAASAAEALQAYRDAEIAAADSKSGATEDVPAPTVQGGFDVAALIQQLTFTSTPAIPEYTVTLKIKAFPYYLDVEDPASGRPIRQENILRRNETAKISKIDYVRGQRFNAFYSDEEVASRQARANAVAELDIRDATVADISHWLQTQKPSVQQILDEVNNDPEVASKVLAAEHHASGGQPREDLVDELDEIISGG